MDVDGTLTDGKIYMGPNGEVMKAFSVKDGYAINYILKPAGITPIVITARKSDIVKKRCDELGITEVYQDTFYKLARLKDIIGEKKLGQCAYIGDDIPDLECMKAIKNAGGLVGCPADAVKDIKNIANYVCSLKAGEGAMREFAEWIVGIDAV
jgi:3-deoxy-D-manno-octulosonate 8-phosphate phosphatase (KDO 8-P phosphatase)